MTQIARPASWVVHPGKAPPLLATKAVTGHQWWAVPGAENTGRLEVIGMSYLSAALTEEPPLLIVTDADSTLLEQEVIDELAFLAGVGKEVAAITDRAMRGELDFSSSLRERAALLSGLPEDAFEQVRTQIHLVPGAEDLVEWAHSVGAKFGVVSGGFTRVLSPIARKLGIDYLLANELEVDDGRLTGKTVGPIIDGDAKARALEAWAKKAWAESAGSDLITVGPDFTSEALNRSVAVGDGANDIPMLEKAGLGVAFCAKPEVRNRIPSFLSARRLDAVIGLLGSPSN